MATTTALPRARVAALLAATAAVYAIEVLATHRLGARVPPAAVVFDLAVLVPLGWWAFALRTLPNAARRTLPVAALSLAGAALVVPHEGRALVSGLRLAVLPFEIAAAYVAVRAVVRALAARSSESSTIDLAERLEVAMIKALGDHVAARLLAAEASAVAYAIAGGRLRASARAGVGFTTHEARSPAMTWGLVLATVVESAVVHLIVGRAHSALAWVLTALGVYAVIWIVGQDRALASRAIAIEPDALVLRAGLRLSARVSWATVDAIDELAPGSQLDKSRALLDVARPVEANVLLRFRDAVEVTGAFGVRRRVTRVALSVDEPRALAAAVGARLQQCGG